MVRPAAHSRGGLRGESDRRPLLSAEELAGFLQVPLSTVYVWNHRRQGPPAHKVGRHLRYRWAEVEAWLEDQAVDRAA
nr:helix-turn-helix domain-containing protein [Streptacidiphilus neutrinimicus]